MIRPWESDAPTGHMGRQVAPMSTSVTGSRHPAMRPLAYDVNGSPGDGADSPSSPTAARRMGDETMSVASTHSGASHPVPYGRYGATTSLATRMHDSSRSVIATAMTDASSLTSWGAEILADACATEAAEERKALLAVGT